MDLIARMLVLPPAGRVSIEEINQNGYFGDSIYDAVMEGKYGRERIVNGHNDIWIIKLIIININININMVVMISGKRVISVTSFSKSTSNGKTTSKRVPKSSPL